jgi:hypothetical protein
VQGSEDTGCEPPEELRARQERELTAGFALASMEYALAREAFHVGAMLRQAGIDFDPLTFVALRVLEVSVAELDDPLGALAELTENGSIGRSVELATDLLDLDAA